MLFSAIEIDSLVILLEYYNLDLCLSWDMEPDQDPFLSFPKKPGPLSS